MWLKVTVLVTRIGTERATTPPESIVISRARLGARNEAWTTSAICWPGTEPEIVECRQIMVFGRHSNRDTSATYQMRFNERVEALIKIWWPQKLAVRRS